MKIWPPWHARLHDHSDALDGTPVAVAGVPNIPATKITSLRLDLARLPAGAAALVLTGQGAGADPAYAGVSVNPNTTPAASDTLRNSNDTVRTTTSVGYVKVKEVRLNAALAACRMKFDLLPTEGSSAYGCIRKNGVEIGTERITDMPATFSEDFTGFALNDLIQIYAKNAPGGVGNETQTSNMRFYYDEYITGLGTKSLAVPLLDTTDPTISMTNQDP